MLILAIETMRNELNDQRIKQPTTKSTEISRLHECVD